MANTPLPVKVWEMTMSLEHVRRLDGWSVGVGRANPLDGGKSIVKPPHSNRDCQRLRIRDVIALMIAGLAIIAMMRTVVRLGWADSLDVFLV